MDEIKNETITQQKTIKPFNISMGEPALLIENIKTIKEFIPYCITKVGIFSLFATSTITLEKLVTSSIKQRAFGFFVLNNFSNSIL